MSGQVILALFVGVVVIPTIAGVGMAARRQRAVPAVQRGVGVMPAKIQWPQASVLLLLLLLPIFVGFAVLVASGILKP